MEKKVLVPLTLVFLSSCAASQQPARPSNPPTPQPPESAAPARTPAPAPENPPPLDQSFSPSGLTERQILCHRYAMEVMSGASTAIDIAESMTPGMEERDCRIIDRYLTSAETAFVPVLEQHLCAVEDYDSVLHRILEKTYQRFHTVCQNFERRPHPELWIDRSNRPR